MSTRVASLPGGKGPNRRRLGAVRITTCKACGWGIFNDQDRHWSQNPLGLVHDRCPERDGAP